MSAPPGRAARLHGKLALAAPAVRAAAAALWTAPDLDQRYADYLRVMHGIVRASVPLMQRASERCAELTGDPVAGPLRRYLHAHVVEERDHDAWLLDDLAAAGGDPVRVVEVMPSPAVAALVGAQYYWLEHHHPVTLLGYVAALESHAPSPGLADRLSGDTGLPATAFRTLAAHAALDGDHVADLDALLDTLPLTVAHETAISVGALHAVGCLAGVLREVGPSPGRPVPGGAWCPDPIR